MRRRGELTVGMLAVFALTLFALGILIYVMARGSGGFIDSLSCEGPGLTELSKAEGCTGEYTPYLMGFLTEKGMTCCKLKNYDGSGGGVNGAKITLSGTQSFGQALVEGQTLTFYDTNKPEDAAAEFTITWDLTCPPGKTGCQFKATSKAYNQIGNPIDNIVTSPLTESPIALKATQPVQIDTKMLPIDETITYSLIIYLEGSTTPVKTYTLRLKKANSIKYAGLTQSWSKRKEVTAACESPIKCTDILFRVQNDGSTCAIPSATEEGTFLNTWYCIIQDGKNINECEQTRDACTDRILSKNNVQYSGALSAIKAAVNNGLIPESVALQFATQQGKTSTYQCVKSTEPGTGLDKYYRVRTDVSTERATFTLEHQSFEGETAAAPKNVCLYGKDSFGTIYVGKPIPLKLDVTPPTAILDFRPGSLQLRYSCTDALSGCKDTFWVAYISQTGDFLKALMAKDTPQNAAAWCPAYATSTGYLVETRPIVNYVDNEVRVLCLRVEDQAGNAGVAMTTVYNAYDLFAKALALAIQESG